MSELFEIGCVSLACRACWSCQRSVPWPRNICADCMENLRCHVGCTRTGVFDGETRICEDPSWAPHIPSAVLAASLVLNSMNAMRVLCCLSSFILTCLMSPAIKKWLNNQVAPWPDAMPINVCWQPQGPHPMPYYHKFLNHTRRSLHYPVHLKWYMCSGLVTGVNNIHDADIAMYSISYSISTSESDGMWLFMHAWLLHATPNGFCEVSGLHVTLMCDCTCRTTQYARAEWFLMAIIVIVRRYLNW